MIINKMKRKLKSFKTSIFPESEKFKKSFFRNGNKNQVIEFIFLSKFVKTSHFPERKAKLTTHKLRFNKKVSFQMNSLK